MEEDRAENVGYFFSGKNDILKGITLINKGGERETNMMVWKVIK